MIILELGKGGKVHRTQIAENVSLEEFAETSDSRCVVSVDEEKRVRVLKGVYIFFCSHLDTFFPGWRVVS